MWMIGNVSSEELEQIKEQGWEIIRMVTRPELNQLLEPDHKGEVEELEDDEEIVCVWIDSDIAANLNDFYNGCQRAEKRTQKHELDAARRAVADERWASYCFHEPLDVLESDGWSSDGDNRLIQKFYYEYNDEPSDEDSRVGSFIVEFEEDSVNVSDEHANLE